MPHTRVIAVAVWVVLAVLEQVLVGLAVIASAGAVVLLAVAGWWGRRLWHALHDLDERVDSLESIVHSSSEG